MIKKYLEYINESNITKEELEDQFLRLKEVFDCDIIFKYNDHRSLLIVLPKDPTNIFKIFEEIEDIKERINKMFPGYTIKKRTTSIRNNISYLHQNYDINYILNANNPIRLNNPGNIFEIRISKFVDNKKYKKLKRSLYENINESNITIEDIEDNLLRLKEVFGCHIIFRREGYYEWKPKWDNNGYVLILIPDNGKKDEINEEIETIMRRIKNIFPNNELTMSYKSIKHDETELFNNYDIDVCGSSVIFKYNDHRSLLIVLTMIELKWKKS